MSPPDSRENKTSRRQFVKWAGTTLAIGVVGLASAEVGNAVARDTRSPSVATTSIVSTSTVLGPVATRTLTTTETSLQTLTSTATETQSQISTSTQIETDTQTVTQTLTSTTTETQTVSLTETGTSQSVTAASSPAPFSVFWITDTQFLSEKNPAIYSSMTNWIVDNWNTYNGKFVIHTGDIVQDGNVMAEWQNADQAMSVLLMNDIPYTWCAGNHDDLVGGQSTSGWSGNTWTSSFNPASVSLQMNQLPGIAWAGDYHEGMNTAATFSVGGLNFLVVNIEWNAQEDVLQWVENILDNPTYANYYTIIAPHAYINAFGYVIDTSNNIDLTDFVTTLTTMMDNHSPNVFLTLNGHYATDCGFNTTAPINGRNQLMFDRQDCTDTDADLSGRGVDTATSNTPDSARVGGATVTILTFDVANNMISASTYDVNTGAWRTDPYEQYTVPLFSNPLSTTTTGGAQSMSG